jgi:hypothetical protein
MSRILYPALPWQPPRSSHVILWHGCTTDDKAKIEKGIDVSVCDVSSDFGRGFYTTTIERQARQWAWHRYYEWLAKNPHAKPNQPIVLRFRMRRYTVDPRTGQLDDGLDKLQSLSFVVGDYFYEDYWSFVQHCRKSTQGAINDHKWNQTGWYDLVSGPVAAFWEQRVAMDDSDQFSFHTIAATKLLDACIEEGLKAGPDGNLDCYTWKPVP